MIKYHTDTAMKEDKKIKVDLKHAHNLRGGELSWNSNRTQFDHSGHRLESSLIVDFSTLRVVVTIGGTTLILVSVVVVKSIVVEATATAALVVVSLVLVLL